MCIRDRGGAARWEAGDAAGGGGRVVGAAAEETVKATGNENVPFVVADGGESGEDVVKGVVF